MGKEKDTFGQRREGYISTIIPKTISRTRNDIGTWQSALRTADNVDMPRRAKLYNLYNDILLDAHLTSQVGLRFSYTLSTPGLLCNRDKSINEEWTEMLNDADWYDDLNQLILETLLYGVTLVELTSSDGVLHLDSIPRNNLVPEKGLLLRNEDDSGGIDYRHAKEYGSWLMEFGGKKHDYGLLNKAVPHVLMKRFAQSCWSELCEIYGIPPRYIKTDTQDPAMLDRAEQMLREMGSAASFVIDSTEEFAFAKGTDTNGDVYGNLMQCCRNEISLLVCGAVLGQDTVNGNRSKEESSMKLLAKIADKDKKYVQRCWNATVIPALVSIGYLPQGLSFRFQQTENLDKLWTYVQGLLPYVEIDTDWLQEKFGIRFVGKQSRPAAKERLMEDGSFFPPAPQDGASETDRYYCLTDER